MNGTNEILDELRSLSVAVAGIGRQTPYVVPEGYFDGFAGRTLEKVAGWIDHKSLIYNVPEGYFDQFAQGVLAKIKAGAGEGKAGIFREAGMDPVSTGADPVSEVLARVGRLMPYQAPEGYFEELSPLLVLCRGSNPYVAPEGYFESLTEVVMARTGQPAVRKSIVRRMSWMKYSAAAVLAGLILTVGWLRWHHSGIQGPKSNFDAVNLAKLSDADLQNFLTDQDTTLAQPISNTTATIDMNDTDLNTLLGDIPDGELKQYMEEHGGASDIATN